VDVRPSDIDKLQERVKKLSYERYLPSLRLLSVRSFDNQLITFDFPVTAVIGTNGGGKSTVLGAAADCARYMLRARVMCLNRLQMRCRPS
jgi:predicted ATPase